MRKRIEMWEKEEEARGERYRWIARGAIANAKVMFERRGLCPPPYADE